MTWPNAERNRNKTHCPQGHPYDDANTTRRNGRRYCHACKTAREAAWRAERRQRDPEAMRAYNREAKRRSRTRLRSERGMA